MKIYLTSKQEEFVSNLIQSNQDEILENLEDVRKKLLVEVQDCDRYNTPRTLGYAKLMDELSQDLTAGDEILGKLMKDQN